MLASKSILSPLYLFTGTDIKPTASQYCARCRVTRIGMHRPCPEAGNLGRGSKHVNGELYVVLELKGERELLRMHALEGPADSGP